MTSVELLNTMMDKLSEVLKGSDYYVDDDKWSDEHIEFQGSVYKFLGVDPNGRPRTEHIADYHFTQEWWESEPDMVERFNKELGKLVKNWKKWKKQ